MGIKVTGFNNMDKIEALVKDVENTTLVAGVPLGNDFLNMVALVQETGKHIEAKNYPYLVIPTANAAGRKAHDIVGLYPRGHTLGIDDASQPNGFKVMFILRKSVDIPSRPFMRLTLQHHGDEWTALFKECFYQAMINNLPAGTIYNRVGRQMVSDLKQTMDQLMQPANAPLTEERKGFNNPLIDTKAMRNAMTWFVIKGGRNNA